MMVFDVGLLYIENISFIFQLASQYKGKIALNIFAAYVYLPQAQ